MEALVLPRIHLINLVLTQKERPLASLSTDRRILYEALKKPQESTMPLLTQNLKPRVILGVMTFGPDVSAGARITSLDEYNKCLDYFQAQGYNEIDTARLYIGGKQEAFTSEAHWKERGLALATKVYPMQPGQHKPEAIKEQFNTSLKETAWIYSTSMLPIGLCLLKKHWGHSTSFTKRGSLLSWV